MSSHSRVLARIVFILGRFCWLDLGRPKQNIGTMVAHANNRCIGVKTPWVFSRKRQEALCELFFSRLAAKQSLVFFYTKSGHPFDETINRLIVGVGQIEWLPALQYYEATKPAFAAKHPSRGKLLKRYSSNSFFRWRT